MLASQPMQSELSGQQLAEDWTCDCPVAGSKPKADNSESKADGSESEADESGNEELEGQSSEGPETFAMPENGPSVFKFPPRVGRQSVISPGSR